MRQLDTYYKALTEYKRILGSEAECEAFLHALSDAESTAEGIRLTRTVCIIETDWIEEIERGLEHIASAIGEERQFILSEGEVLPVERVKNVSPESVKHLAKHSNLISRPPVDGTIIPDSIYTVERLNDYTVYENRFLYMLLCYLRDFVSVRLEKIIAFSHRYESSLILEKALQIGNRSVSYRIDLNEGNENDPYLREHSTNKEIIDRISLIFRTVLALLATPLMEDVSKASMLKPPITKTNVLKMDKHFRGTVELYDYIMAYDKPGYTVEEETRNISPFDSELSADLAKICSSLAFVTYANALGITSELANRFEIDSERQKAEKIKHYGEELSQIKRRMQNGEIDTEEYIYALEKKFSALEAAYESTEAITEKLGLAEGEILSLRAQNTALDFQNSELNNVLEVEVKRHTEELKALDIAYAQKVVAINEEHQQASNALKGAHDQKVAKMYKALKDTVKANIILQQKNAALLEEKLVDSARIKAILSCGAESTESFTDKESFDQLEKEYKAFTRFYKKQWKKAKREIRKKLLNFDALKGQKGDENE